MQYTSFGGGEDGDSVACLKNAVIILFAEIYACK
jgi:hypothetical protein